MEYVCVECKIEVHSKDLRWNEQMVAQLRERMMCFKCSFWTDRLNYRGNHAVVRVNGEHYMFDTRKPYVEDAGQFRGFGGAVWIITFLLTGDSIITNDLWTQGTIPEHFRSRMPDNATLERKRRELPAFAR